MVSSVRRDGYLLERGPSALLATYPKVTALVTALALDNCIVLPSSAAKRRYIVKQRRLAPLPQSPLDMLGTSLLSSAGKLRVLAEPFVRLRRTPGEESLASFVIRRLGQEALDYFVNPFVGGVYAGDPERLSVEYAFPKLFRLEQEYGSLIKGALLGAKKRSRCAEKSKLKARMFSFDGGMQLLIDALEERVSESIRLECAAVAVKRIGSRWQIVFEQHPPMEHVQLCFVHQPTESGNGSPPPTSISPRSEESNTRPSPALFSGSGASRSRIRLMDLEL